jgi:hypothetical protein
VHAIIVENVRQPHPHPTLPHRGGGIDIPTKLGHSMQP